MQSLTILLSECCRILITKGRDFSQLTLAYSSLSSTGGLYCTPPPPPSYRPTFKQDHLRLPYSMPSMTATAAERIAC